LGKYCTKYCTTLTEKSDCINGLCILSNDNVSHACILYSVHT
jgi:hypothetical protein